MKAVVVSAFHTPPRYQDFPAPIATGATEQVVDVLAAGLHPRVRSQADGSHYTSTGVLPLVPGIDGVGRGADGQLRYFLLPDTTLGTMAEQTLIDTRRSVVLPEGSDCVAVAAALNPAMSSWVALRRRIEFRPGQSVLVLGATGNAGRMAVQVAKMFGADRIVAAARNADLLAALPALGATGTVPLGDDERLAAAAAEVDVVLDYLWGQPTADAMAALVTARPDRGKPLSWVQIGSVAGPTASIPSAALRASHLQLVGSGQGSVGTREILAELPVIAAAITAGTFDIDARPVPLAEVEQAWAEAPHTAQRLVLTP
ncbi:quinone oxidoreductase family protein [Nocardia sp. alder85J]|uniref:quinone oxidoreductase family protein n=1 Tax=Nocardia sp. alder85J TaxID=2862949 RepID=UPI001CD76197|nr:zinc-binding alcohol dehydrogenase family protein [Nocardia sp. alder85J]MCX4090898.1 zinc-binding alcohol dehydrogenase family protein [Nocardia sp. alder85J]